MSAFFLSRCFVFNNSDIICTDSFELTLSTSFVCCVVYIFIHPAVSELYNESKRTMRSLNEVYEWNNIYRFSVYQHTFFILLVGMCKFSQYLCLFALYCGQSSSVGCDVDITVMESSNKQAPAYISVIYILVIFILQFI